MIRYNFEKGPPKLKNRYTHIGIGIKLLDDLKKRIRTIVNGTEKRMLIKY